MPPKQQTDSNEEGVVPSWRRSGYYRNRIQNTDATNTLSTSKLHLNNANMLLTSLNHR